MLFPLPCLRVKRRRCEWDEMKKGKWEKVDGDKRETASSGPSNIQNVLAFLHTYRVNLNNVPTRKLRCLRNARIFLYKILLICSQDNCAKVCCFVLYLLDIRQIDSNANFKNEFCNCTNCTKG